MVDLMGTEKLHPRWPRRLDPPQFDEQHLVPHDEQEIHELCEECACHPVRVYYNSETGEAVYSHRSRGDFS